MEDFVCAWCRKPGAIKKVAIDSDGSVEGHRYFCNVQHMANWDTNQPRSTPIQIPAEQMTFWELAKELNLSGWTVLNSFQIGVRTAPQWRINLQKNTYQGATLNTFTEFADDSDPRKAMLAAYKNAMRHDALDIKNGRLQTAMPTTRQTAKGLGFTPAQEKRLATALDNLYLALKLNGTRGADRTDDL